MLALAFESQLCVFLPIALLRCWAGSLKLAMVDIFIHGNWQMLQIRPPLGQHANPNPLTFTGVANPNPSLLLLVHPTLLFKFKFGSSFLLCFFPSLTCPYFLRYVLLLPPLLHALG